MTYDLLMGTLNPHSLTHSLTPPSSLAAEKSRMIWGIILGPP